MANVILPGQTFRHPRQLWDHTTVAAGSAPVSNIPLFSVPIGQNSKTKFDTNLLQNNRLNPGEAFFVHCLSFYFNPNMLLTDIFAILNGYYFEFVVGAQGRVYADGPLWLYPASTGLAGVTTKNNESAYTLGTANLMGGRRWGSQNSIDITDQTYFGVNLVCPGTPPTMTASGSGGAGLDLWCFLDGPKDSLVQG